MTAQQQQQQDLRDRLRVAVVTGASQGLGRAIAERLARRGWALVLDARRADRLDDVVADLWTRTAEIGVPGDVTDPEHRRQLVAAAASLGRVEAVVNNASTLGTSPLPALLDAPLDVVRRAYEVNVVAPLALVQELRPHLADGAAVVNVTSDAGVEAYERWGVYGSSKAALEHLSRVLAEEEPGLRVLVVDPGDMRTEMHQDAFPGEDISDRPPPGPSADGIVALVEGTAGSGRYVARDVPVPAATSATSVATGGARP
jgi:NAD(P)-dependent dehydrogenase (short-subunit alcohol dehydrogenase family)